MATNMARKESRLKIAFTPDPDDAFSWWAIIKHHVNIGRFDIVAEALPIQKINEKCIENYHDIAAVSSAVYPIICHNYAIIASGASVGRGYGPVLASRNISSANQLIKCTIAVPGRHTTGALLLRIFFDDIDIVELPCDQIAKAILDNDVDAGVLIHEELLNCKHKEIKKLCCLGNLWQQQTGLPIPVGLNVVKRTLDNRTQSKIATAIRQSLQFAMMNRSEASKWAMKYSSACQEIDAYRYIEMFANDDTLALQQDSIKALSELYRLAYKKCLIPEQPLIDIILPEEKASFFSDIQK